MLSSHELNPLLGFTQSGLFINLQLGCVASNRLQLISGTSASFVIDLVDADGNPLAASVLASGNVKAVIRRDPTESDLLTFATPDLVHLALDIYKSTIRLSFTVADINSLPLGSYFYRVELDLADGEIPQPINWTPLDVVLGGSATPEISPFASTVKLTQDYSLSGNLRYMTPGGSPIANAQIRVYQKADYDAGRFDAPIGITLTDTSGGWVTPIFVPPGYSYVIQFFKAFEYGPDVKEVLAV